MSAGSMNAESVNAGSIAVRMSVVAFALVALLAPLAPARADDVPVLDVAALCHGIASQSHDPLASDYPQVSFEKCMQAEQDDKEQLKKEWPTFNAVDKVNCTAEAKGGGESSYTDLMTCLEMARDVRELNSQTPVEQHEPRRRGGRSPAAQ